MAVHKDTHPSAHVWKVATIRDTQTLNTVYVFMRTNAHTHTVGRSRSVNASASFVQLIIEMKAK